MPKKEKSQDLALPLAEASTKRYRWLYEALRAGILQGRLRPRSRLPSTRNLAKQYGVSRGTVVVAFEQLQAEGYIESRIGSGSFVTSRLPDDLFNVHRVESSFGAQHVSKAALSRRGQQMASSPFLLLPLKSVDNAFRANQPALDLFPTDLWSRIASRRLRQATRTMLANGEALGYLPLREAVAAYVGSARGVQCTPEQVVIVSSTQQALDLIGRLVLDPGDKVWVENPGYSGAVAIFRAAGADVIPVPVDDNGLIVEEGRKRALNSRLVYVTPAHQFPLGRILSLERRLALLEWAQQRNAWIFEDDYDSEYRYAGRPLAALQGLDQSGCVIHACSFSKVLFPSLRLGYLIVPPRLIDAVAAARSIMDRYCSVLDQAILSDFILEGHFGQHIRRMRECYAERLGILVESSDQHLRGLLDLINTDAGLQTVGWLPARIRDIDAARAAAEYGIEVLPTSRFSFAPPKTNGLLLGFAAVAPAAIRRGIERLAKSLEQVSKPR